MKDFLGEDLGSYEFGAACRTAETFRMETVTYGGDDSSGDGFTAY